MLGFMGKNTLAKIDRIVGNIHVHPEYSSLVSHKFRTYLVQEAERHSAGIELAGEQALSRKDYEKAKSKSIVGLREAREYLITHGINLSSFSALSKLIDPDGNKYAGFRKDIKGTGISVGLVGEDLKPFDPSKIPFAMKDLSDFISEEMNLHPVTKAIHTHIEFARIHPYEEGNGRASRLVQNLLLEQKDITPAIIRSADREIYLAVLKGAISDRNNSKSSVYQQSRNEIVFHDFIEAKVLDSTELLENELRNRRVYDIDLYNMTGKEVSFSIKKGLSNLARRYDKSGLKVSLKEHAGDRRAKIEIIGNVGISELKPILENLAGKLHFNYSLTPRKGCC